MIVAFPCEEPSPESEISPHFGRARYFCIYRDGQREIVENPGANAPRRAGVMAANTLARLGVQKVVAISVGPNVQRILQAAGIEIITVPGGRPVDVIKQLL